MDIPLKQILETFEDLCSDLAELIDLVNFDQKEYYKRPINFEFKKEKLLAIDKYENVSDFITDLYNSDDTLLFFILLSLNYSQNVEFGFKESYNHIEETMKDDPENYICSFEDLDYGYMGEVNCYELETKNLVFKYSISSGLEFFEPDEVQLKNE